LAVDEDRLGDDHGVRRRPGEATDQRSCSPETVIAGADTAPVCAGIELEAGGDGRIVLGG